MYYDLKSDNNYKSLQLFGLVFAILGTPYTALASTPVTAITTEVSAGATNSYATTWYGGGAPEGQSLGTPVSLNFSGEVRRLATINISSGVLPIGRTVGSVVVHRNVHVYGDGREGRTPLRFEASNASIGPTINLDAPYVDTLESALLLGAVNVGVDNLFVNASDGVQQQSNVERVDFLFTSPLSNLSTAQLDQASIPIFDITAAAGGSEPFKIAALRGASNSCSAPTTGPLIASGSSGPIVSETGDNHSLTTRRQGSDTVMRPLANRPQGLTGQAFSLTELGFTSSDTVCGFSLYGSDSSGPDAANPAQNPVFTPNGSGGLDLVAATGLFLLPEPPVANDNSGTFAPGSPVTLDVLENDQKGLNDLDPSTVVFVNPAAGSTLEIGGKNLTVPNEGTWTIDPTTGTVTFTPLPSFIGNPSPVQYTVSDTTHPTPEVSNPATVTLTSTIAASKPTAVPVGPWLPLVALLGIAGLWIQRREFARR